MRNLNVLFLFVVTGIFACGNANQKLNCSQFRTGKFELVDEENGHDYLLERNDSLQIETDRNTDLQTKFRVYWLDECSYDLEIVSSDNKKIAEFYKNQLLHVTILEVYDDGYKFSSQREGSDFKTTFEIRQID